MSIPSPPHQQLKRDLLEAVCRVSSPPRSFSLGLRQKIPLQPSKSIVPLLITLRWIPQQQPSQLPHTSQHPSAVAAHKCRPTPLPNPRLHRPHTHNPKAANTAATYPAVTTMTQTLAGAKPTRGTPTPTPYPTGTAIPAPLPHHYPRDLCETMLRQHRTPKNAILHFLVALAQ